MEGELPSCLGAQCPSSCCAQGTMEPTEAFRGSEREALQDRLKSLEIDISQSLNFVYYTGCSDGKSCKLLGLEDELEADIRPLACKIFPYHLRVISRSMPPVAEIYLQQDCPVARLLSDIPDSFTTEVIALVEQYYLENYETHMTVKVVELPTT